MDSKKSNKITEIVRLQQILKKWKKLAANASKVNTAKGIGSNNSSSISPTGTTSTTNSNNSGGTSNTSKSIKFLKKTLSFSERESSSSSSLNHGAVSGGSSDAVPKGYLAVCVGEELKRFVIPMEYLGHQAFGVLLREAEEEFGFQQEGVLKIPCQVAVFEKILKMMDERRDTPSAFHLHDFGFTTTASRDQLDMDANTGTPNSIGGYCYSPQHHQPPQMCR